MSAEKGVQCEGTTCIISKKLTLINFLLCLNHQSQSIKSTLYILITHSFLMLMPTIWNTEGNLSHKVLKKHQLLLLSVEETILVRVFSLLVCHFNCPNFKEGKIAWIKAGRFTKPLVFSCWRCNMHVLHICMCNKFRARNDLCATNGVIIICVLDNDIRGVREN